MHQAAYSMVRRFAVEYCPLTAQVGDVGSYDVNETLRKLFGPPMQYTGLDLVEGPNVDELVEPYYFGIEVFDVVVSVSTAEHVQNLRKWADAVVKATRPGGLICVVAPHTWVEHPHPVDCWRILPDGMKWMFRETDILECFTGPSDTCLIAKRRR